MTGLPSANRGEKHRSHDSSVQARLGNRRSDFFALPSLRTLRLCGKLALFPLSRSPRVRVSSPQSHWHALRRSRKGISSQVPISITSNDMDCVVLPWMFGPYNQQSPTDIGRNKPSRRNRICQSPVFLEGSSFAMASSSWLTSRDRPRSYLVDLQCSASPYRNAGSS